MRTPLIVLVFTILTVSVIMSQTGPHGTDALGTRDYDDFEKPRVCKSCHTDFYQQWTQAMMSQAYTHHWDEIEYFNLAVPHSEVDEMVAGVRADCNGCHSPIAYLAGDVPPPRPEENSRANESVSCDVCHTITGFVGDVPYNFNYISSPGRVKRGPKPGRSSPHHDTELSEFIQTAEFCGTCHNEMSPYGVWVKSTQIEWSRGPYAAEGVPCHRCHIPRARGRSAKMAGEDLVAQHLFFNQAVQHCLDGARTPVAAVFKLRYDFVGGQRRPAPQHLADPPFRFGYFD